jgi:hypothetical protein
MTKTKTKLKSDKTRVDFEAAWMLESCPQGRFQIQFTSLLVLSLVFGADGGETGRLCLGLAALSFQPCALTFSDQRTRSTGSF